MAAAGPAQDSGLSVSLVAFLLAAVLWLLASPLWTVVCSWVQRAGVSAASHVKKQRRGQ